MAFNCEEVADTHEVHYNQLISQLDQDYQSGGGILCI